MAAAITPLTGGNLCRRLNNAVATELSAPNLGRMAKALENPEAICVLIVEDDDDSREMLGEWVSALGHRELRAANAEEASKHVLQSRPDLALIDLGLPGVDGYQLARDLRGAVGQGIRLVALTGYSDVESRRSADAAGFDDFVVKPVGLEVLVGLLRRGVA